MARYYKKRNYRKKRYTKKNAKNTKKIATNRKRINQLVKSTLVKTYWKHNDDRVQNAFPNEFEPVYRAFTPLIPQAFSLLFNKMTTYTQQQKVRINSAKVNITLTLANAVQSPQPIDYSVFCVKIKPRMRAQFYQNNSNAAHQIDLIEDIHYTGNTPAGMAATSHNLANIRLNPDIFQIHYYKHGYFSTNIKNQTASGSETDHITSLQLRRCTFNIPYKCELKSDAWLEDPATGNPTSNRYWTELSHLEVPLFNRYHILIFTSAKYSTTTFTNSLQASIQTLFNATSAN